MPRVQQYEPNQVEIRLPNTERASRPGDTGLNTLAQGVNNLGAGFEQMNQRFDETAAEEALQKFEREKNKIFFEPETGYFNTQGRNAFESADTTANQLLKLKDKYSEELSSEQARNMFSRAADVHITRGQADIMRHSSKGFDAWELSTIKAGVENAIESGAAYWNDEDSLNLQHELGRGSVMDAAKREGIGAEATNERLQNFDSAFASAAVGAALQHGSGKAQELLTKHEKWLEEPDKIKLEGQIAAKKKAEHDAYISAEAVNKATVLVNRYSQREDVLTEIDKISDPELRRKAYSEAMYLFNQKNTAAKEAEADAFEAAENFVQSGGSVDQFIAQNEEMAARMTEAQINGLRRGKGVVTDHVKLSNLLLLSDEKLAKIHPVDHFQSLSPTDRNKLTNAVRAAREAVNDPSGSGSLSNKDKIETRIGQSHTAQMTLRAAELFGPESGWDSDTRAKVNAYYQLITEQARFKQSQKEDGILTTDEFDEVISKVSRKWVQERKYLSDPTYDITNLTADEMINIPRFLRENGMPVDTESMIRAKKEVPKVVEYLKKKQAAGEIYMITDQMIIKAWQQASQ